MQKIVTQLGGALIIGLLAFYAGRWSAPTENTEMPSGFSSLSNTSSQSTLKSAPSASAFEPQAPITTNTIPARTSSYAADLEKMKALLMLATSNPLSALEQTHTLRGKLQHQAQTEILNIWGANDPYGAWNWVTTNNPEDTQSLVALLQVIGRTNQQLAIEFAEPFAQANPRMQKDIYLAVLEGMNQAGAYDTASLLVEYLDLDLDTKTQLMDFVAESWATYEPQAAMEWALNQPKQLATNTTGRLAATWANNDPEAAIAFANTQDGESRSALIEESFSTWVATDPSAAKAWLIASPANAETDQLINTLIQSAPANSDEITPMLNLAGRIHDPQLRINALLTLLSPIKQGSPESAKSLIQNSTFLSTQERNQLLTELTLK